MKKQILIVHGGNAFNSYNDFIENLKTKDISLEKFNQLDWKNNLNVDLGNEFDVIFPKMPNPQNAKYSEWKIWFERIIELLNEEIILIGHSLGGIFLAKYLSENSFSKKIKGLILVSPPYNTPTVHPLADFVLTKSVTNLVDKTQKIILFHSKDDKVVPFSNTKEYVKQIPTLKFIPLEGRGHIIDESFPEIVEEIKNL